MINDFIKGLQLMATIDKDFNYVEAEHDIIYCMSYEVKATRSQEQELEALGFNKSEEYDCWVYYC